MYDMPKVRIDVEAMRYQIIHAFSQHNDEIEKALDQELVAQLKAFDFKAAVRQEIGQVLQGAISTAIRNFFSYGNPGEKVISEVINSVLKGSLNGDQ
jgi:hypothetical protein